MILMSTWSIFACVSQGGHSETVLLLALFDQSTPSWIKVIGWCGGGGGGVVAHVILVSALGPNPSFFLFWGTFIRLWGLDSDLDQGLTTVKMLLR